MVKHFTNKVKNLLETSHLFYAACKLVHSEDPANRNRLENVITINVPLFKKLRDIIFFWWDKIVPSAARDNLGVKKVEAPSKWDIMYTLRSFPSTFLTV